ncbi:capsular polysaccharide export protein, LipB/KpsS family [Leisingera caerulea]|uniref:capsular polysaccharide export protein, LipB/KpsS family n=1 Tax=Leisingera caerulea TaxID=506591 RepID=UPI003F4AB4A8
MVKTSGPAGKGSFRKLNTLGQLLTGKTPLVVHATKDWYGKIRSGQIDFFEKIAASAAAHGHKPLLVPAESITSRLALATGHKHIAVGLRKAQGPNILHAHTSYLWGFWYLDPKGYYWSSSLVDAEFDPSVVDAAKAAYFFNGVSGHMKRANVSKLAQPERGAIPAEPAAAAVFLQEIDNFKTPVHYLTTLEMIENTSLAVQGLVYVKLHPAQADETRDKVLRLCAELPNVAVTQANVHDLIEASDVIVSQNSAVGFEALMHKKPAVTCARIDYHHAALAARTAEQLQHCVRTAPQRLGDFSYEKYFYWFLGENMLEPQKEDFTDRAWARIAAL